ncbi:rhodanese-like domain-containing protein [Paenisporosarcina cavernae]|uniref:Rhodanese-like domain-containing protein n=1 Tax=Paenisporosarcina cavernae TaxID=2320858 RepID=A0A385YS57_9BACL|nr:rhodanese-like domain-containing protein [Paenisporosarcina cavernae]AYC29321.1 rhodanese-like domain-containing protein [Paenisporosarcina cavernae]
MKSITTEELQERYENGEQFNIVDVREADEVAEGKIPGATHIPLGLIEFKHQELDKSKEYHMVCRSGGRSGRASQFLESQGYNVVNVDGGMMSWTGKTE